MSASFVGSAAMTETPMVAGTEVVVTSGQRQKLPILLPFMMKHADDPRQGWAVTRVVKYPPFYDDQRGAFTECGACGGVPRMPVQLVTENKERECSHIMCAACAMKLLSVAEAKTTSDDERKSKVACCPRCRVEFKARHIKDYETWFPQMKMLWQLYRIRCGGRDCTFVGSPKELLKHEFDCPLRLYKCPCDGCTLEATRTELMTHVYTCKMLRIYCKTCFVSYYPNGEGEYGVHNCLEDLKLVCMMMKNTLMQNDVMWPVRGTCGFEPVCAGDADFETEKGTAAMLSRKTIKRLNGQMMDDAFALVSSSPGGTRRLRLEESSVLGQYGAQEIASADEETP